MEYDMDIAKQVGLNIKMLRKRLGFSQEKLAYQIEMSPAYLRRIECGLANPTLSLLQRIAYSLNTTVSELTSAVDGIDKP